MASTRYSRSGTRKSSRKTGKSSKKSTKRKSTKDVSTNARLKKIRMPSKMRAPTHPEGDLSKHLGIMKRPFMQGIAQPKIPDGEVTHSLGERLRTTGQIICKTESYLLLFPSLGHCLSLGNASTNYIAAGTGNSPNIGGTPSIFGELPVAERNAILRDEAYESYVSSFSKLVLTDGELRTMFEYLVNQGLYVIDQNALYQKYVETFPEISVTITDLEAAWDTQRALGTGLTNFAKFTDWMATFGDNSMTYPDPGSVKGWLGDDYFILKGREPKAFNDWAVEQDFTKLGFEVYQEDVADRRSAALFPNEDEAAYLRVLGKFPKSIQDYTLPFTEAMPKAVNSEWNIFHRNHDFGWRILFKAVNGGQSDYSFEPLESDKSSGWRIVSQACRLELLNNDHENDGWFEACRFKARISPDHVSINLDHGGSGAVISDANTTRRLLPAPDTDFWAGLDNISFNKQKGYISGKLTDIGKHEFTLLRDKGNNSIIPRESLLRAQGQSSEASSATFGNPQTTTGKVRLAGSTHGSVVLNQLIDRNLDCVLIKVYGRSDVTSPTRLMFDCIQNIEYTVDPSSDVAKYQTANVAHPNVEQVMDVENNNESASRRK